MHNRPYDPQQTTILGFQLPHPTLDSEILRQGCGTESPTVESEQPKGAAKEDLVDRRYRRTPRVAVRCGGGFSPSVSLIT